MAVNYTPHGLCDMSINENIITIAATGPFNKEYFTEMHANLIAIAKDNIFPKYGVYLKLIGQSVWIEEAYQYHIDFIKKSSTIAVAINLTECHTTPMTKKILEKVYPVAGIEHQFFDDDSTAIEWIKAKLG